jgi:chemotaxis protein MotB
MSGHGGGGSERWLVSYSDFITLLMVLFVVLYSMGQVDIKKYKQLAESLKAAFSGGPEKVVDAGIDSGGGSPGNSDQSSPIVIPGIPKEPATSVEVAGRLTDMLALSGQGGEVSVQNNIEGVLISLSEKLTFTPGTSQLQPEAYPVLDTIANMLDQLDNEIRIIGYTDNTPPVEKRYATNWDLSAGRAVIIANYLTTKGVPPQRMLVAGRGEYKPIFANDTPEHRALNSRAEIIVVYSVSTDVIDVNLNINPEESGEQ